MKPIDGEKLIEFIDKMRERSITMPGGSYCKGFVQTLIILDNYLKEGKFNLPPGTLIIQREVGFDKRDCYDCIAWNDDYYSCNLNMFEFMSERCSYEGDRTKINCGYENVKDTQECKTCQYVKPCKYHTTEEEIKNAYIVGGDDKCQK